MLRVKSSGTMPMINNAYWGPFPGKSFKIGAATHTKYATDRESSQAAFRICFGTRSSRTNMNGLSPPANPKTPRKMHP